jgi:hypothetical protein
MTFSKHEKIERFRETVILLRELNSQVKTSMEINKNLISQIDSIFYLINDLYSDVLEKPEYQDILDENVRPTRTGRDSKE